MAAADRSVPLTPIAPGAATTLRAATLRLRAPGLEVRRPLRVGLIGAHGTTFVEQLAAQLTGAGCEVVEATRAADSPAGSGLARLRGVGEADELAWIARAYRAMADVDVVHDQTSVGPAWAAIRSPHAPIITTVREGITAQTRNHWARLAALGVHVVVTSRHQSTAAALGTVAAVIRDGIDLDEIPVGTGDGGYVVFDGSMDQGGGADRAVAVARAAGMRILLVGSIADHGAHQHFARVLAPLLGTDVRHVGEVGPAQRLALLGGAAAVLCPRPWMDPSADSLVEALATGTPVLTIAEGAATEVVEHGRTGFLCADEAELVAALGRVPELDRAVCRSRSAARFSMDRMTRAYLALYQRVLAAERVSASTGSPTAAASGRA